MSIQRVAAWVAECDVCYQDICPQQESPRSVKRFLDLRNLVLRLHDDEFLVCSSCIRKRACRIFGHVDPAPIQGLPWTEKECGRCYQVPDTDTLV